MRMQGFLHVPLQTTPWLPRGSPLQQGRLRSQQRWHKITASGTSLLLRQHVCKLPVEPSLQRSPC